MKKVIVYSKPNCMMCEMTKKELTKLGVEFTVESLIDEKNSEIVESFVKKGFRSAPITLVGEEIISGFNPVNLKKALAA